MILVKNITSLIAGALMFSAIAPSSLAAQEKQTDKAEKSDVEAIHYQEAYDFAFLVNNGITMSPVLQNNMRNQIRAILLQDTYYIDIEKDYPGILHSMLDKITPIIVRQVEGTIPDLVDRYTKFMVKKLTIKELKELKTIFNSPTITRIRNAAESKIDITSLGNQLHEGKEITAYNIDNINQNVVQKLLPKFSDSDRKYLLKISSNPAFQKFTEIKPSLTKIEAAWSNESTPENDNEIVDAIAQANEEYIAKFEQGEDDKH